MNLSFVRFRQELLVTRILGKDFNLNSKIVVGSYPNRILNREKYSAREIEEKATQLK